MPKRPRPDLRMKPLPMKRWGFQADQKFLIVYARSRLSASSILSDHTKASVCVAEILDIGPESFCPKAQGRDAA